MAIVKVSRKLLDEWPILDYSQLTRRERQITELLLTGKKRESIVTLLGITSEGVHKHINNVFRKLRVNLQTSSFVT